MKINEKILSLPPYLTTSWSNIQTLYVDEENSLGVVLSDGTPLFVPGLSQETIQLVFTTYEQAKEKAETETRPQPPSSLPGSASRLSSPSPLTNLEQITSEGGVQLGFGTLEGFGGAMQHNSQQMHAPDLPPDVINKIAGIVKVLVPPDPELLPKPEPHCNCMHCQIARAIQKAVDPTAEPITDHEHNHEEVSEEDLRFRSWDIKEEEQGNNIYIVTNPLDSSEQYRVHLGNPVGCTCGQKDCEHIRTVLLS